METENKYPSKAEVGYALLATRTAYRYIVSMKDDKKIDPMSFDIIHGALYEADELLTRIYGIKGDSR